MADDKKCCDDKSNSEKASSCCGGNGKKKPCCKFIFMLIILIAVAVGVFVYIKNNKPEIEATKAMETEEVETTAIEKKENKNPILVKLNGEEIKRQDVLDIINAMPPQMKQIPMEQLFPMALEQLINNNIIDKEAADSGLEGDEEVKEQLEQAKTNIIRAKFVENAINAKITDDIIKEKYDEYVKNFPDVEEVKAAHILVDDEKKAKAIIKKLDKGAEFAELAKENSKDGSSDNGGDLGYFTKADVVPEFAEVAFATKVGEYTKSPVKSDFGFHIIKIEEKRKRPPAEFSQIKPYIEQELRGTLIGEVIEELKSGVNIERFDVNGNPLPVEKPPEEDTPVASEEDTIEGASKAE